MSKPLASTFAEESSNLRLTPQGHLLFVKALDAPVLGEALQQALATSFARGAGHGLLCLGASQVGTVLPPTFAWWRDLAARYVTALCALPEPQDLAGSEAAPPKRTKAYAAPNVLCPEVSQLETWIADAPPMQGAEYLSAQGLADLWAEIEAALDAELQEEKSDLATFLKARHPAWNLVGRVYFNLAENRKDPDNPFAFMATYTARLSAHGTAQHLPLSKALEEMSDGKSQAKLLSLLQPVQLASVQCASLRGVDAQDLIAHVGAARLAPGKKAVGKAKVLDSDALGDVFGLEMAEVVERTIAKKVLTKKAMVKKGTIKKATTEKAKPLTRKK